MSKIIVINKMTNEYKEGDLITYEGNLYNVESVRPVPIMGDNTFTSLLIERLIPKEFNSLDVLSVIEEGNTPKIKDNES